MVLAGCLDSFLCSAAYLLTLARSLTSLTLSFISKMRIIIILNLRMVMRIKGNNVYKV